MTTIKAKFDNIHADLEANVTKIYQRRDLMTAFDLVMHSVLQFRFQGDLVRKGWVEALVLGDTRCGKSETVDRMTRHYRAGATVTGENTSFAGLVGGLQQTQKTWSITWGQLPLNDRRAVTIDEASGLQPETISRLSGVRSSGIAEIIKIQTERTPARVRQCWMSNPRGKRPLAGFNSGVDAIMDLIGHPEDIARFTFALTVASSEVPLSIINSKHRPKVPHRYTSDACNRLVYWAWTRKPDQVVWSPGAEDAVLEAATAMSRKYVPPLVEGAEQRIKIAQLAVATAARVFSTDDGHRVIVSLDHVQFVFEYLDQIYSKPSMAFDLYSRAKLEERQLHDPQAVQDRFDKLPDDARPLLADAAYFSVNDIQDFTGLEREASVELASFLTRKRCVRRGKFGYYKLPAFIEFLRYFKRGKRWREPGDDDAEPIATGSHGDVDAPF